MFDRKIEPIAQKVVRAKLILEEAKEQLALAEEDFKKVIPEGEKYVTKDGETISHAKGCIKLSPIVEGVQAYLKGPKLRIWKSVRIDAVDNKKLNGFIDAGELDKAVMVEAGCFTQIPVKSSIRINFPAVKPMTGKRAVA
jgi:hypothetical protein